MKSVFHPEAQEEFLASVEGEVVVVYAVMHLHREPGYWKNRL